MTMSDEQKTLIKRLTTLLKENGSTILTDGAPLCLTVSFLQFLNSGFSVLVDDDFGASFEALPGTSTQVPICQDLQFLYDFIQKTPNLKLMYDSASNGEVTSIAAFRSLLELELKRVPASMVTGLSKMRRKLKVLVCNQCLQHLEDVLEHHDGDSGSPLMWTQLTSLCCSYNFISKLDNSLRLLPIVDELDLSHNSIYDTNGYLEHLTELQSLDLGFNLLAVVPSLSFSCQSKLRKLSLRHNQLENIEGVQELHNLMDLDLAYNCLSSHRLLWPLKDLEKLQLLFLEGNPLSYHSKHRLLTVKQLHPVVIKQLVLDRRKLDAQESVIVQDNMIVSPTSQLPREQPHVSREHVSLPNSDFLDSLDESTNYSANSMPSPQKHTRVQRKKKHRRPRTVEITDASDVTTADETSHREEDTEPETCLTKDCSMKKEIDYKTEMEIIRNQLGSDWLRTFSATQESTKPNEPMTEEAASQATPENLPVVGTDLETTKSKPDDGRSKSDECVDNNPKSSSNVADTEVNESEDAAIMTLDSLNVMMDTATTLTVAPSRVKENHSDNVFSWSKIEAAEVDYGSESEPFIVRHPEGGSTDHFLVTVAERYVLEKDIEGNVTEALDQRCLKRVDLITGDKVAGIKQRASDELILVRLYFDYYKKARAERCYIMEDRQTAESLIELLEPAVELHTMSEALQDLLQCLKCNTQFSMSDNKKKFASAQREFFSDDKRCPKCNSDLIIELDMGQISRSVGQHGVMMTFDLQSEGPTGMLHKPSAQSTPIKSQESNRLLYDNSPHGSLHTGSVQLDSPIKMARNASSISLDSKVTGRSLPITSSATDTNVTSPQTCVLRATHRQVSESSDIIVLDEKRQSVTSTSSDIAILSSTSEVTSVPTLSPIRDSPSEQGMNHAMQDQSVEVTPCGSLSENTIHSMVSSIYENTFSELQDSKPFVSICDDSNVSGSHEDNYSYRSNQSFQSIQEPDSVKSFVSEVVPDECCCSVTSVGDLGVDPVHVRFSYADYNFIDHRLKLYLSLEVIGGEEELCFLLQCDVVSCDKTAEFTGIVVLTNTRLYVFSAELPLSAERLAKSMKLKNMVELNNLEMAEQGYGDMSLYLIWEKAGYRLLIRDVKRCQDFVSVFKAHLQTLIPGPMFASETITTEQTTANNIITEVLSVSDVDTNTDVCLYVMCHQRVGALESGGEAMSPVSVIVTPGHVAMVTEDESYVLDALFEKRSQSARRVSRSDLERSRRQFEVKDLQKLTDIVTIEIASSNQQGVSLTFSEEDSPEEYTWRLVMATADARELLVSTVTRLWEEQFGVEFVCKYS